MIYAILLNNNNIMNKFDKKVILAKNLSDNINKLQLSKKDKALKLSKNSIFSRKFNKLFNLSNLYINDYNKSSEKNIVNLNKVNNITLNPSSNNIISYNYNNHTFNKQDINNDNKKINKNDYKILDLNKIFNTEHYKNYNKSKNNINPFVNTPTSKRITQDNTSKRFKYNEKLNKKEIIKIKTTKFSPLNNTLNDNLIKKHSINRASSLSKNIIRSLNNENKLSYNKVYNKYSVKEHIKKVYNYDIENYKEMNECCKHNNENLSIDILNDYIYYDTYFYNNYTNYNRRLNINNNYIESINQNSCNYLNKFSNKQNSSVVNLIKIDLDNKNYNENIKNNIISIKSSNENRNNKNIINNIFIDKLDIFKNLNYKSNNNEDASTLIFSDFGKSNKKNNITNTNHENIYYNINHQNNILKSVDNNLLNSNNMSNISKNNNNQKTIKVNNNLNNNTMVLNNNFSSLLNNYTNSNITNHKANKANNNSSIAINKIFNNSKIKTNSNLNKNYFK